MIVRTEPANFEDAQFVVAFSDAENNSAAIREITRWSREQGFVRSNESFLNVRLDVFGQQIFYEACYRLDENDSRAADKSLTSIRDRREQHNAGV